MAKALAGRPEVLLLDEVMAGLNEAELAASVEIARNVRDGSGRPSLWVEHVMSAVVQLAERAIVLNFGKVLAEGAPGVVMRDPQVVDTCMGEPALARSPGWQPGTSASASSRASTSRFAPVRQ